MGCGCGGGFGGGGAVQSVKVTITHTQLQAAALSNNIQLFSLPAGAIFAGVKMKHSVAFGGGAIASYRLSVGVVGLLEKYMPLSDVFAAPAATDIKTAFPFSAENQSAAVSVRVQAVSTGANLNASTGGSADFWIFYAPAT